MKIKIGVKGVESADDQVKATTYYGGYVTINGKKLFVSGTDRDDDVYNIVKTEIEKRFKVTLSEEEDTILYESLDFRRDFVLAVKK